MDAAAPQNADPLPGDPHSVEARRRRLRVLVGADAGELARRIAALGPLPAWHRLRRPEIGLVMVRGRIGGEGAPFNLGEATATRCAIALESGETGFGYLLGRDAPKAEAIALLDALSQRPEWCLRIERDIVAPIAEASRHADAALAAKAAATKVDFFTMVRGEDS
ncbi:phosphonate C-P lyase system protein PhnG [Segnochrobactrum spirostomi]|uniref:Phosphonate C-P lyase system protein PhnG n=1 Tax=Segnochrobactrum spirostomi TaxID=2608987 RepID=A0A6A7Y570_9HYPH|nr:phosphonate C-P lyase system protein PhnG [Segnochrobactrum spirostomi]MQT12819.1 phosphonate C-P lyase system protein PhnG [Segnochrobactrum spirostomi]